MTKTKKDYDQEFAEQIISMLENQTAPWVQPWDECAAMDKFPTNPISKTHYRGCNILRLFISAARQGFTDTRWMTFNQASSKDLRIKKGQHGTPISFFKWVHTGEELKENGESVEKGYMACKGYVVFNAEQIEGMESIEQTIPPRRWQPVEIGEKILEARHADIKFDGGNRAYYHPATDSIHLPMRAQFPTAAAFYSTACHELAHWTGHESRLNRKMSTNKISDGYAQEELRAEIASWMISVQTGLPFDPEEHASYIGDWIKAIKKDFREIYRASADAQKIVDYLTEGIEL